MEENAILKTLERMNEGLAGFFWDAFTAVAVNGVSGDYVEFGSWGCNTLRHAFHACEQFRAGRRLWAFDSFQALPPTDEPRDQHPVLASGGAGQGGVEAFHAACADFGVPRDAYTAVEGYYQDTLPPLGADGEPRDIAIAYVDCNLYSSTVTVLEFLAPRLKPGMIVGFDDYYLYNRDSGVSGEREALSELLQDNPQWHFQRFKDIHWGGVSFVVEHSDTGAHRRPL
ncbi:MAG: TylF/MycF/NovP-related O-methyltransferase [Acidimicrobiales bacterium]